MSLQTWAKNGWLRPHKTSRKEVADLFQIVERDLRDAKSAGLSDDWRFGIAYNAALKLCSILLFASGYRPEKNLAHYRTLQSLPLILGKAHTDSADYLETCRIKRNETEYDFAGGISAEEADELIQFVEELRSTTCDWLKANSSTLMP